MRRRKKELCYIVVKIELLNEKKTRNNIHCCVNHVYLMQMERAENRMEIFDCKKVEECIDLWRK